MNFEDMSPAEQFMLCRKVYTVRTLQDSPYYTTGPRAFLRLDSA